MDHIEALRREGEFALTEYLPDIICVMKTEQDPCKIKAMFKEYIQVFKGGVKDHFMSSLDQYDPKSWAHVNHSYSFLSYGSRVFFPIKLCLFTTLV